MTYRGLRNNFTGGEVSPDMLHRIDIDKYPTFCVQVENFLPKLFGSIAFRTGFQYIAEIPEGSVLIPFSFNTDPEDNYSMVFSNLKITVYDQLDQKVVETVSPYATSELPFISYKQVADVVYLFHVNHPPAKYIRESAAVWSYNVIDFSTQVPPVIDLSALPPTRSTTSGDGGVVAVTDPLPVDPNLLIVTKYAVTVVDPDTGFESLAEYDAAASTKTPAELTGPEKFIIRWDPPSGLSNPEYNIYREEGGVYMLIGITEDVEFEDKNQSSPLKQTLHIPNMPFDNDNPSICAIHQQRLCAAGTSSNLQKVYMSRTGNYENFYKHRPVQEDGPIEFILASTSIDQIIWISSLRGFFIGTSGGEYQVEGAGGYGSAITPTSRNIYPKSTWGSQVGIRPLEIGSSILHISRQGDRVNELSYDENTRSFQPNDLSIFAKHLLEGYKVVDWCYRQSPDSTIWIVRDDGVIIVLTYLKEYGIMAWSRQTTDGKFKSITSISNGENQDRIYASVERDINGETKTYLEKLADDWEKDDSIEDAKFLDSHKLYNFETPNDTLTGLGHLEAKEIYALGDGEVFGPLTVENGSVTLAKAVTKAIAGILYVGIVVPVAFEGITKAGTTLGKSKGIGEVSLKIFQSFGGSVSGDGEDYADLEMPNDIWGGDIELYTGNVPCSLPGSGISEQESLIYLKQDVPFPFHLQSIAADIT